jgi:hypothetical protein
MKVEQLAPNQFIIRTEEKAVFQSYNSIIAEWHRNGTVILDQHFWNYSKTTSKYRNMFLNETTLETRKKIENGTYKLAKLN